MDNFDNFIFRPQHTGIRKILGELETEIMELLWQRPSDEDISVRDVFETLRTRRSIAYTTVMTTASRLAKKGLLSVAKVGKAYVYRVRVTKEELTQQMVTQLFDSLLLDVSGAALSYFVSSTNPADREEITRMLGNVEKIRKEYKA